MVWCAVRATLLAQAQSSSVRRQEAKSVCWFDLERVWGKRKTFCHPPVSAALELRGGRFGTGRACRPLQTTSHGDADDNMPGPITSQWFLKFLKFHPALARAR
jgi:hypothetical protein